MAIVRRSIVPLYTPNLASYEAGLGWNPIKSAYNAGKAVVKTTTKAVKTTARATARAVEKAPSYAASAAKLQAKIFTLPTTTAMSFTKKLATETAKAGGKVAGALVKLPYDTAKATVKGAASVFQSPGGGASPIDVQAATGAYDGGSNPYAPDAGQSVYGGGSSGGGGGGGGGELQPGQALTDDGQPADPNAPAGMTTQTKVLLGLGVAGAAFLAWKMLKKKGH